MVRNTEPGSVLDLTHSPAGRPASRPPDPARARTRPGVTWPLSVPMLNEPDAEPASRVGPVVAINSPTTTADSAVTARGPVPTRASKASRARYVDTATPQ